MDSMRIMNLISYVENSNPQAGENSNYVEIKSTGMGDHDLLKELKKREELKNRERWLSIFALQLIKIQILMYPILIFGYLSFSFILTIIGRTILNRPSAYRSGSILSPVFVAPVPLIVFPPVLSLGFTGGSGGTGVGSSAFSHLAYRVVLSIT